MEDNTRDAPAITHVYPGPCSCAACDPYGYMRAQQRQKAAEAWLRTDKDGRLYGESEKIG